MLDLRRPGRVRLGHADRIPLIFVSDELAGLGREAEGVAAWRAIRDLRLWLEAEPPLRPRLFAPAPPDGRTSELAALAAALRGGDADAVAEAAAGVAVRAEAAGAHRTAAVFFEAAAEAAPGDPHLLYRTARALRSLALYGQAEAWFGAAHRLGRRLRRWDAVADALLGLGNLHRQRGNLPRARRFHEASLRVARERGLRERRGNAAYDLAVVLLSMGDLRGGMARVREAVEAYGPGHPQLPRLAKDLAWVWMDALGEFAGAADLFEALLPHVREPRARLLLLADLARASAGAGRRERFARAWVEARAAMRGRRTAAGHAAALVQLSLGAAHLGRWTRARRAAEEALRVARRRGEGEAVVAADAALEAALRGERADAGRRPVADAERREAAALAGAVAEALAAGSGR